MENPAASSRPYFWAKTTCENAMGLSVREHMRIVGEVARILFRERSLADILPLPAEAAAFLSGSHDCGKVTPGFQMKSPAWKACYEPDCVNAGLETRHAAVTQHALFDFLQDKTPERSTAKYLAAAVAAHHGQAPYTPVTRLAPVQGESGKWDWSVYRRELLQELYENCNSPSLPDLRESDVFLLAGLTSVADWIGSGEARFPPQGGLEAAEISARAEKAVTELGFAPPPLIPGLAFEAVFPFAPNALQQEAARIITASGIYCIEAPMGMGKTEAALYAAYGLLAAGKASGLYFALPTQVSSNRIHERLEAFLQKILQAPEQFSGSQLIHGASWLIKETMPFADGQDLPTEGRDWFASNKRALLAPFGVGTLDQALLAVIGVKHHFVRRFALAGKVVILDEVHSYDTYTGTLLDQLCALLCKLGCTVILLSATLTPERRARLLQSAGGSMPPSSEAYPLISGIGDTGSVSTPCAPPASKTVQIRHLGRETAFDEALEAARQGARVLWVENTVAEAQRAWLTLRGMSEDVHIGLLHSRFPFYRRSDIEARWLDAFGKNGQDSGGAVLVATQVVEQSVDIDADLLISALAPTDMLLQRCGRLWRHPERTMRPLEQASLWLLAPDNNPLELASPSARLLRECFGPAGYVYEVYILLRSFQVWQGLSALNLPGDIRSLLRETYDESETPYPQDWENLLLDYEGKRLGFQTLAKMQQNLWGGMGTDQEGLHTRLGGLDTVSLVLCRETSSSRILLANGATVSIGKTFCLDTAKALHRNLVKVPAHWFKTSLPKEQSLDRYVFGDAAFGLIGPDSRLRLSSGVSDDVLCWTPEMGVYRTSDMHD